MVLLPPNYLSSPHRSKIGAPLLSSLQNTLIPKAQRFDIDTETGFLPPQAPLKRLPDDWEHWESILDVGRESKLQLGVTANLSKEELETSALWREHVATIPILPTKLLMDSEILLYRAHHVLSWIVHLYVHTLPVEVDIHIPAPISIPLLQVSTRLEIPPINTYVDNVLHNWKLDPPSSPPVIPSPYNLRCQTLFSGTTDEEVFFLTSTRIELGGVEALELMLAIMKELRLNDLHSVGNITAHLQSMALVIRELRELLLTVRKGCDPDVFYRDVRPWLGGQDMDPEGRKWHFDGIENYPGLEEPVELSGPSAGQSPLIHALDIFLGVDKYSHLLATTGDTAPSSKTLSFLDRMQSYMTRPHRNFLRHLQANPRPLRDIVSEADNLTLLEAYNSAVQSLKDFRDAHMIIVALYIVVPAKRARQAAGRDLEKSFQAQDEDAMLQLKGTGGTDLFHFLKGVRDHTASALILSDARVIKGQE